MSNLEGANSYDFFRKLLAVIFEEIGKNMQMNGEYSLAKAMTMLATLFKYDLASTIVAMIQDTINNLKIGVKQNAVKTNTQRVY